MVAVIRALEQILADLRRGQSYQITRLTRLKRLCADSEAATQFAAFVAQRSLHGQMSALAQAQNTYKNIPYGAVRIVECWEAMLVERALRCILTPHDTARLGYELARYYVERYDPRYGTGLIPVSAEPLEEVIGFWRAYAAERQQHTGIAGEAQ